MSDLHSHDRTYNSPPPKRSDTILNAIRVLASELKQARSGEEALRISTQLSRLADRLRRADA